MSKLHSRIWQNTLRSIFIYLRTREHTQGRDRSRAPLSGEPDVGFDPRVLRS